MQDLGRFYQQNGFLVRGILLEGHGTIPEQLKDVEYSQWVQNIEKSVKSLRKVVDEVYLTGFSTGGLLALYHCLTDTDIKAVVTLCPALKLNKLAALGSQLFLLTKKIIEHDYWHIDSEIIDPTKYNQFPINAVHQVTNLGTAFEALNKNQDLKVPLFMIATENDETVKGEECFNFFERQTTNKHMIYYSNHKNQHSAEIEIIKPHNESIYVLDYSHIAIPVSPQNKHYGINADYQQPIYYHDTTDDVIYKGALSKHNLKYYNLQRLNYNPKFELMCTSIKKFLEA
jgi:esterase/lipase